MFSSLRSTFFSLGFITVFVAQFMTTPYRVTFTMFGLMFIVAGDQIKEKSKVQAKERALTEIRMTQDHLSEQKAAWDDHCKFVIETIAGTFERALNQVAFSVKDASPSRHGLDCNVEVSPDLLGQISRKS